MVTQLLQVGAFMRKFEQFMASTPVDQLPEVLGDLGKKLINSERLEMEDSMRLIDGVYKIDKVEMLDGLTDLLYVILGQAHRTGLATILPVAFRVVHESNMTKLWTNEEVRELVANPGKRANWKWKPVAEDGADIRRWLVVDEHGKAMKSPSYTPADLRSLLDELEGQELLSFDQATQIIFGDDPEPDADPDEFFVIGDTGFFENDGDDSNEENN